MPPHPFPGLENGGMSQGIVMARGYAFAITHVRLWGGQLEIEAERQGPTPAMENEPAAIFGADGQGLGQGPSTAGASITIRATGPREVGHIALRIRLRELTAAT